MNFTKTIFTISIMSLLVFACESDKDKTESNDENIIEEVSTEFQIRKDKVQSELLILKSQISNKLENMSEELEEETEEGLESTIEESENLEAELNELKIELDATADGLGNSTEENIQELEEDVEKLKEKINEALKNNPDSSNNAEMKSN